MTIKVKASEKLFNQWQKVGRVIGNLASIVQNDMEIEPEELAEWEQLYQEAKDNLREAYDITMVQLRADNGPAFNLHLLQAHAELALNNLEKEQQS